MVIKLNKEQNVQKAKVGYYTNVQAKNAKASTPAVYIEGNFFRGGFQLSKNKIIAILQCAEELRKFADGAYDEDIGKLKVNTEAYIPDVA